MWVQQAELKFLKKVEAAARHPKSAATQGARRRRAGSCRAPFKWGVEY